MRRRSRIPRVVDSDDLFTVVEASCLLGITRANVRWAVVRGDLDPVITLDGARLVPRDSVLEYHRRGACERTSALARTGRARVGAEGRPLPRPSAGPAGV